MLAEELVAQARESGIALTGPGGLLSGFTSRVLQTALEAELTEHLGHEHGGVPGPGGNVLYVWVVNPAVKNADYSANAIIKLLAKAFPTEATAYYNQLREAMVGRQPLNLALVNDFSK